MFSCHRWRFCCFPESPKSKCTSLISFLAHHDFPIYQSILLQLSQVLTFGMGPSEQIGYGGVQRVNSKANRSIKPSTTLLSFNSCGSSLSAFSDFGMTLCLLRLKECLSLKVTKCVRPHLVLPRNLEIDALYYIEKLHRMRTEDA